MAEIFVVRTTLGREEIVADLVAEAAKKFGYKVYSIFIPKAVKGYIFIEAESVDDVTAAIRGINHARGIVKKSLTFDEVKHFFTAEKAEIKIKKGDIVEIVSEPFKGEKAKVIRVDPVKREATVELLNVAVPIPMTLPIEALRFVKEG